MHKIGQRFAAFPEVLMMRDNNSWSAKEKIDCKVEDIHGISPLEDRKSVIARACEAEQIFNGRALGFPIARVKCRICGGGVMAHLQRLYRRCAELTFGKYHNAIE